MNPQRLTLISERDGLRIELTYTYEGKLPKAPQRREAVARMLRDALTRLEAGVIEAGFAANDPKKMRRDVWIAGEEVRA